MERVSQRDMEKVRNTKATKNKKKETRKELKTIPASMTQLHFIDLI